MAGFLALLFGCSDAAPQDGPSNDDLQKAALHNLWPIPRASKWYPKSDAELDQQQRWVDEKRAWVATIEDRRIRDAYAGWVDYVEKNIAENREENRTQAAANERAASRARYDAERRRGYDLAPTLPKPPR